MKKRSTENENPSSNRRSRPSETKRSGSSQADMENNPLHEIFLEELADIHNAEKQLIKALPKMAKAAQSEELRQAFESHLEETRRHAQRIEEAVKNLGESLEQKKCKAMEGLVAEASEMMEEHRGEPVIDALLIAGAQKVEHYEIASYGTVCAWAELMGHDEVAQLLKETLDEEKAADEKLTNIAESVSNLQASAEE